jgi:hypothetical protein
MSPDEAAMAPTSEPPEAFDQLLLVKKPGPEKIHPIRIGTRTLHARTALLTTYWRFAAERQRVFHHRAPGAPATVVNLRPDHQLA